MKIGFIGLGNAGGKLAGSLLRNGYDLTVRDLDRAAAKPLLDRGASWAGGRVHSPFVVPASSAKPCHLPVSGM